MCVLYKCAEAKVAMLGKWKVRTSQVVHFINLFDQTIMLFVTFK